MSYFLQFLITLQAGKSEVVRSERIVFQMENISLTSHSSPLTPLNDHEQNIIIYRIAP